MENKIYMKQLVSYHSASEIAKERMGREPCFDLGLLPTETMQEEMRAYIMHRSQKLSAEKLYSREKVLPSSLSAGAGKGKAPEQFS